MWLSAGFERPPRRVDFEFLIPVRGSIALRPLENVAHNVSQYPHA
jgi:hypothetical protein